MEMLMIFVGMIIAMLIVAGGNKAIESHQKKQLEKKMMQLPAVNEQGYHVEYDPHLTRRLEIAEGVNGILTRCDDTTCAICYWKARNKYNVGKNYTPTEKYYHRINSFIDSLPDDLLDFEYDEKLKTFKDAQEAGRIKAKQIEDEKKKARELETREEYYSTPNHLIDKYLAEGRVFNKNGNCWTDKPKPVKDLVIRDFKEEDFKSEKEKTRMRIEQRMARIQQREREMDKKLNDARAQVQDWIDKAEWFERDNVSVEYDYDMRTGEYWKYIYSGEPGFIPKGRGKRYSKHYCSQEEYERAIGRRW